MFRKIINTLGTKVLGALLSFIVSAVISQMVGDVGKGEQTLLLSTIAFILIFSDIVSGASLVYLTPKHPFSKLFVPSYLWSTLVGLTAAAVIPLFYHDLPHVIALHIGLLSVLSSLSAVNTTILIGRERVRAANWVNLWQPAALLATLCICYFQFEMLNLNAYIIALYVAYGGSWLAGLFLLRNEFRGFRIHAWHEYREVLRDLFRFGLLNQSSHFVQFFNLRLSYYLLDTYVDIGSTGVFSNAVSLVEAVWIISRSIALVQYARIANANDQAYSQRLTLELSKVCLLVSAAAMILLACFPPDFYRLLFGPEFGEVTYLIWILAPGALLYCLALIFGHYYSGIGKYHINTYTALCGVVFTLLCGFTLIPAIGIYGAAITTTCANAANAIFISILFLKQSHLRISDFIITPQNIRQYYIELKGYCHSAIHPKTEIPQKHE